MSHVKQLLCAGVGRLNQRIAQQWILKEGSVIGLRRSAPDSELGFEQQSVDLASEAWPDTGAQTIVIALSAGERSVEAYRRTYLEPIHRLRESFDRWQVLPERIVVVSSTRVYGEDSGGYVDDESAVGSEDPYAQILIEMEQAAQSLPVSVVIARLSGIYGPGRNWLQRMALQADPDLPPDNSWTNRIHMDDAAQAIVHLLMIEPVEASYIISDTESQSRFRMFNYFREKAGLPLLNEVSAPQSGKQIVPSRLIASGFQWRYPNAFAGGYDV